MVQQSDIDPVVIRPISSQDNKEHYAITGTNDPSNAEAVLQLIDNRIHYFGEGKGDAILLTIYTN